MAKKFNSAFGLGEDSRGQNRVTGYNRVKNLHEYYLLVEEEYDEDG
jgi:hypothetical protein